MSNKKRVLVGNAMSKVLARMDRSGKNGTPIEAILRGDFFPDDYEKETSEKPSDVKPDGPRKRGRPRKHPVEDPAKTSVRVPGVYRVGKTLKTRVQFQGRRIQVDLKTNKWAVARERKGLIDGLIFEGTFLKKAPPIAMINGWNQFKATHVGAVEASTFGIYVASMENHVLPMVGSMPMHELTNQHVDLILNNYQGIHSCQRGTQIPDTAHLETMVRIHGYTPDGGPTWKPNFDTRNKGGANLVLTNLKCFYYWCLEHGLIEKMPFTNQKFSHSLGARPYVGYLQIRPFLDAVERHARDKDLVLACRMAIFLGLRKDEIRRAEWWWIAFDTSTFTPRDTKGKECDPVPIPPALMKVFREEFERRGRPLEDVIFQPKNRRKPEDGENVNRPRTGIMRMRRPGEKRPESEYRPYGFMDHIVARAGKDILKHGLTPHRLRATFATLHALSATPIRDIQAMLRHKHITTTLRYIEDIPEIRQLAQMRMEKLAGFGEMGADDVQTLRAWSEDLAAFLHKGLAPKESAAPEAEPLDIRLILGELVPLLERLTKVA